MTDHKNEAESYASPGSSPLNPHSEDDLQIIAARTAELAHAQVHATLYLAEQQRVANLIAAYSSEAIRDELRDGNGDEPDKGRWAGGSIGILADLVEDVVRGLDVRLSRT